MRLMIFAGEALTILIGLALVAAPGIG
jgi:hypothetical protein